MPASTSVKCFLTPEEAFIQHSFAQEQNSPRLISGNNHVKRRHARERGQSPKIYQGRYR